MTEGKTGLSLEQMGKPAGWSHRRGTPEDCRLRKRWCGGRPTWGHLVYLIDDKYLFTGDTIWFGPEGGCSFLNGLAEDNKLAVKSLAMLEQELRSRNRKLIVISGHTGWSDDLDFVFAHTDTVCHSGRKQKPHDPEAIYDAYDESDDTKEKAQSGFLKKAVAVSQRKA